MRSRSRGTMATPAKPLTQAGDSTMVSDPETEVVARNDGASADDDLSSNDDAADRPVGCRRRRTTGDRSRRPRRGLRPRRPMTKTIADAPPDDGRMSLMDHLIELRSRLIKCAIAIAVGSVLGWMLYNPVFTFLRQPLEDLSKDPDVSDKLLVLDPLEGFMLRIKMSAYIGIALAMPFLLWQVWKFISPGLYRNERRYASAFVMSATTLFVFGAMVAYFTLPAALGFLTAVGGDNLQYQFSPQKYLMLIVYMMAAFGVGFEFPIVLVALQLVGVLKPQQLRDFRRFGIVIIFVVAAVITPSADPISLFALALPMVVFYEISILIGLVIVRRRAPAEVPSGQ